MRAHKRLMIALADLARPGGSSSRQGRWEIRKTQSDSFIARNVDSGEFLGPSPSRDMVEFMIQRSDDLRKMLGGRNAPRGGMLAEAGSARAQVQAEVWKGSSEI